MVREKGKFARFPVGSGGGPPLFHPNQIPFRLYTTISQRIPFPGTSAAELFRRNTQALAQAEIAEAFKQGWNAWYRDKWKAELAATV